MAESYWERAASLGQRKLPRWEELPDLDLYMDQVLSLIHRYLGPEESPDGKGLTSSMVNNYVKMHIMPPPEKKKYNRIHLAYLITICVLKASLPMAAVQDLLSRAMKEQDEAELYDEFCRLYEETGRQVLAQRSSEEGSSSMVILRAALRAQTEQTLARQLAPAEEPEKKDRKNHGQGGK